MLIKFSLLSLMFIFYSHFITEIFATKDHYVDLINGSKHYLTSDLAHGGLGNHSSFGVYLNSKNDKKFIRFISIKIFNFLIFN